MNNHISTKQSSQAGQQINLPEEHIQEIKEYATSLNEKSTKNNSTPEDTASQLRDLQDEINQQANELQSCRSDLVREESRLQHWEKSLREEKSAWIATKRYATEVSILSANGGEDTESAQSLSRTHLQLRKTRLQQFKKELSQLRKDIEQQIEDWKRQVEQRDTVHHSRKVAFEKRLAALASMEQNITEREDDADLQQVELSNYETELALKEHELASTKEDQEIPVVEADDLENELNIDFTSLFDESDSQEEEKKTSPSDDTEKTGVNDARSALAEMFDLPNEEHPKSEQSEEIKEEPKEIKPLEVELMSARFMKNINENTTPKPTVATTETKESNAEPEEAESVTAYMERLLGRQQTLEPVAPVVNQQPEQSEAVESFEEQAEEKIVIEQPTTPSEPKHKLDHDEVKARRDSLRELANFSARTAVAKHTTLQMQSQLKLKFGLTFASFIVAAMLLTSQYWGDVSYFTAGIVMSAVSGMIGLELVRSLLFVKRINKVDGES